MNKTRGAVNTLIDGKLYQRSQIMTWQRPVKMALLDDYKIDCVVNLWPKIDPDFWGTTPVMYLQVPAEPSTEVLRAHCVALAKFIAEELKSGSIKSALVLCEAGKTRSVFFSILVCKHYLDISGQAAMELVLSKIPSTSLKPKMISYLEGLA